MLETAELLKLIANYGLGVVCLAVIIGLHLYNVYVAIPRSSEELKAAVKGFQEQIDRRDVTYQQQMDRRDISHQDQVTALTTAFRAELAAEREQCHEDHEKIFDHLSDVTAAVKENQAAILRLIDRTDSRSNLKPLA